jgi:alpha-N-acetylglucosaminidase
VEWDEETKRIVLSGTTGVSALFGLNHYLKYFCNAHMSWEGTQLDLPLDLPRVSIKKPIVDR